MLNIYNPIAEAITIYVLGIIAALLDIFIVDSIIFLYVRSRN